MRHHCAMPTLRPRGVATLAVAAVFCAAAPGQAQASPRTDAQRAARSAANRYTGNHFGISGRAGDWKAACLPTVRTRWICAVVFNGGQCSGSLRLKKRSDGRFRSNSIRISCGE
jgi:hypothetical protein